MAPNASSSWPGHPELADDEDVERRLERARHLEGHRDPTARQGEHERVGSPRVRAEPGGEEPPGMTTIAETALVAHTASFAVTALGHESAARPPVPK